MRRFILSGTLAVFMALAFSAFWVSLVLAGPVPKDCCF